MPSNATAAAAAAPIKPSVTVENHGSVFVFQPHTTEAWTWLEEHTEGTWWAGGLVVEPRYAEDLARGIREAGFTVGPA